MAKFGGTRARRKTGRARAAVDVSAPVGATTSGSAGMSPSSSADAASAEAASEQVAIDYARVGEHVGTVLEAAKKAAEQMRQQAASDARQLRSDAQLQAHVVLDEAQTKVERADAEATRLYAQAQERSEEIREESEEYAAKTRDAADVQAAGIIADAERQAAEGVEAAHKRKRTLDRKITATEQRLRELVGGVREVASGLEELLPETPLPPEAQDEVDEDATVPDDTLPRAAAPVRLPGPPSEPEHTSQEHNGN